MSHATENTAMYQEYNEKRADNRNDLLTNPQVSWQNMAQWYSKVKALQYIAPDRGVTSVLDVGCGSGTSLLVYLELGFPSHNLTGVDIWDEQISLGREILPGLNLLCQDATDLIFADNSFDIVTESTMFLQMTDDALAGDIASEMLRVLKPKGHLVITDWRYGMPGSDEFKPVNKKRLNKLFFVGSKTKIRKQFNGALIPPVGRFLSQYLPFFFMPVKHVFPFMVGMKTTVLQKV